MDDTPTQRWKFTLEYDGTPFYGWQRQSDVSPTVQGAIEDAIYGFCQTHLTIHVAGRTDAGVHARGQVFHADLPTRDISPFELHKAINAHLVDYPISILSAEKASPDFHARFDAKDKLYTYRLLRRSARPTLEAARVWHFRRDLDVSAMRKAAQHLLGQHDFTTFRDSECQAKSPIKTLDFFEIEAIEQGFGATELRFHTRARSFLHHQVRNMVGTLTLVGDGKWSPDDFKSALAARDRTKGGPTAPASGLYLMEVTY